MDWYQILDIPPSVTTVIMVLGWSLIGFFSLRGAHSQTLAVLVTALTLITRSLLPIFAGDVRFSIDWILQSVLATSLGGSLSVFIIALIINMLLAMFLKRNNTQSIFSRK